MSNSDNQKNYANTEAQHSSAETHLSTTRKKLFIALLSLLGLFGGIFLLRESGISELLNPDLLREKISSYGIWAPIVFIALYATATILFFPATPLTLIGGAVFGPIYGTVFVIIGATTGAQIAFLLTRYLSHLYTVSTKSALLAKLATFDEKIRENGFLTVLFLRFVPLFPFNGLNFGLGFTKVKVRDYFFGTFLGIIPGTFVYVYFGDSLSTLSPLKVGSAVLLIATLTTASYYVKKKFDRVKK